MHILTYFTVAIIWISTCNTKSNKRISGGGHPATTGDYPFFVQLKIIDKQLLQRFISTRVCGGGLIQTKWVLTAASCFYDIRKRLPQLARRNNLIVYAGTIKRFGRDGTKNFIKKVHIHNDYYENLKDGIVLEMKNDIAVAELKKEYKKEVNYIIPASLPATNKRCKEGTIMGIGLVENNNDEKFNVHVLVDWRIRTKARKDLITPVEVPLVDTLFYTEMRTGGHKAYPMPGDTGGPFRCQAEYLVPIIYGINSRVAVYNSSLGAEYHVGYYESVYAHLDFILQHVPDASLKEVDNN